MDATNAQVHKVEHHSRYELVMDDKVVGVADYRLDDEVVVFPHTEIAPPMRGRGLGEMLVRAALDDVRESGRQVVARCWFVREFIDDNPEYADLHAA
ncbi:MAG: GNAT family N-acetyltransferase [Acidimicrobiales bacterium]